MRTQFHRSYVASQPTREGVAVDSCCTCPSKATAQPKAITSATTTGQWLFSPSARPKIAVNTAAANGKAGMRIINVGSVPDIAKLIGAVCLVE